MGKKMSLMGAAGKIAAVLLISAAVLEGISYVLRPVFAITENYHKLVIIGAIIAAGGFALNLTAAFGMLGANRKGQLATGGFYAVFLHPMYTFQLLVTVPGLLLFFNSWLTLAAVVPSFIAYKIFAKDEEMYLENKFGVQYKAYRERVFCKFL